MNTQTFVLLNFVAKHATEWVYGYVQKNLGDQGFRDDAANLTKDPDALLINYLLPASLAHKGGSLEYAKALVESAKGISVARILPPKDYEILNEVLNPSL